MRSSHRCSIHIAICSVPYRNCWENFFTRCRYRYPFSSGRERGYSVSSIACSNIYNSGITWRIMNFIGSTVSGGSYKYAVMCKSIVYSGMKQIRISFSAPWVWKDLSSVVNCPYYSFGHKIVTYKSSGRMCWICIRIKNSYVHNLSFWCHSGNSYIVIKCSYGSHYVCTMSFCVLWMISIGCKNCIVVWSISAKEVAGKIRMWTVNTGIYHSDFYIFSVSRVGPCFIGIDFIYSPKSMRIC